MPGTRSAIFIQRGVEPRKQAAACMEYIDEQRWSMLHVVPYHAPDAAVSLVRDGQVDVIVTAYDSRAAQALAADIDGHGQVIFVHPRPTVIEPPTEPTRRPMTLVSLILKWVRGGRTPKEIAAELETDTSEIRAIIRRKGGRPDRTD